MNDTAIDYQKLLTDTLQKQMVILGPTITLAKARHVAGLNIADDGRVISIEGHPQEVSIKLLEQFRELSPLMVKKTMKPLLNAIISSYPTAPVQHTPVEEADKSEENEEKNDVIKAKETDHKEEPPEEKHEPTPAQPAAA